FHAIGRDRAVRIVDVSVIPQPVGAYLDTAVASGREQEFADAEVLILDPGFFSVDWVLMSGTDIQYEFSSSSTLATSRLLEEVEKLIYQEFECRVPVNKLERAIREGRKDVPIFSDRVELAPLLGRAAERVSDMVMNNVRASMRSKGADITKVVLAGGGAEYYRPAVAAIFPRAEIILPKNPVLANARGFWHYAQL
ncbi:MAG: ParM/StbA family protein, partial [Desulfobulbaceae bacterium]